MRRPHSAPSPADDESDLFRKPSRQPDRHAPRVRAAFRADRLEAFLDEAFGELSRGEGRVWVADAADGRLHLIKHARGLLDEQVCAQWLENAYFQYFSGGTYFQTGLLLGPGPRCRCGAGRIGPEKLEALIAETLAAASERAQSSRLRQMRRLTIDTTAQTKAVAHPTDSHLALAGDRMAEPDG